MVKKKTTKRKVYKTYVKASASAERQAGRQIVDTNPRGKGYIVKRNPNKTKPKRRVSKGLYETRSAARRAAERRGGKDKYRKAKGGWRVESSIKRKRKSKK